MLDISPILSGWGKAKRPPYQFFPCDFCKRWLARKTFRLLVLILLPHWCKISSIYLVPVQNYQTRTKTTPQKKRFFWSNPYKIEVTITSLIEMLESPIFGHMTKFTMQFESGNKFLLVTSWEKLWRHNLYFKIPLF